jgi:hypothetical protein
MRAVVLLLTVILLPVGTAQQSSMNRSETKGSCSPATSGSQNTITINCNGFDKSQAADLAYILTIVGQNQLSLDEVTSVIKKLGADVTAISHPLFTDSIRVEIVFEIKPSDATEAYLGRIEPLRGNGTTSDPIFVRAEANDKSILPSTFPHSKEYPLAQLLASDNLHVNALGLKPKLTFGIGGNCRAVTSYPEEQYIANLEYLRFVCHVVNPEYNSFRTDVASFLDLIGQELCVNFYWAQHFHDVVPVQLTITNGGWSVYADLKPSPGAEYCSHTIERKDINP